MEPQVLDIKPGDTLIFSIAEFLSKDQRNKLKERLYEDFPDAGKIVVLEGGITITPARPSAQEVLEEMRDLLAKLVTQTEATVYSGVEFLGPL